MKIKWHCLECGESGDVTIDLLTIILNRKENDTLINLVISFVNRTIHPQHENIGVKTA